MNILVSYNWIKDFLKTKVSAEEFSRHMTEVGNSVEHTQHLGQAFEHVVVGEIIELKAHPNADKLRIAITDVGQSVQIVCGGVNLFVGQRVAVALPGAHIRWHGQGGLVELKETEIRGVKSFGMICAPDELGFEKLQQSERVIWDITNLTDAKPGTSLAKALDLDDVVFDIEVTTNRPDAMSVVGLAREAAVAGLGEFLWKESKASKGRESKDKVSVEVLDKKLCPRYQAVVIAGVTVKPSPWWMQARLLSAGHRPINNVVDVTNYVLHELGQPLHAFDADRLDGGKIIVRRAKNSEKIKALDGKEYTLHDSMLVIADAKRPVAIAGVMGGEVTGIIEKTTRLVIESANFEPVSIRRTARALGLYSDSSSQFEKGLSTEATAPAINRAIELICELTGGHVASCIVDSRAMRYKPKVFPYDPKKVDELIGVTIPATRQKEILKRLAFVLKGSQIEIPYWRDHDIENSVDFAEEVARMHGYDNLPSMMPTGEIPFVKRDPWLTFERTSKEALAQAGCVELYSMSFISQQVLEKLKLTDGDAVRVVNPLSEDQRFMRPTLLGSLLEAVEFNQHRVDVMQLFEISTVHRPRKNALPDGCRRLIIAVVDRDGEFAFRRARGLMERWGRAVGVPMLSVEPNSTYELAHSARSAEVYLYTENPERVGFLFEISSEVARRFGIDLRVAVVELNLEPIMTAVSAHKSYTPPPEFPGASRDLSFLVDRRVTYAKLHCLLCSSHQLVKEVVLVDVYQGKGIESDKKSMTFSFELRSSDHTLTSEEAEMAMRVVVEKLKKTFDVIMR
ncbi:MAG: phenylalanine--tRNA ligase subunit beta [Patescibacteria group bacterium]